MAGETRKGSVLPEVTSVQDTDQLYLMRLSETLPQQRNKRVSLPNLLKNAIGTVLKFTQSGTGAVERTVDSKLKEAVSVKDFGETVTTTTVNQAAGVAASSGRQLVFPSGQVYNFTYTQPPYGSSWKFENIDQSVRQIGVSSDTVKACNGTLTVFGGPHPTHNRHANYDRVVAKGSGINGPGTGVFGRTIDIYKDAFGSGIAACGEIDGLYIVVRNDRTFADPATYSDSAGILIDCDQMEGTGFSCLMEGNSKTISRSDFSITKNVNVQLAPLNEVAGAIYSFGIVLTANYGQHDAGVLVQSVGSSAFQDILVGRRNGKSVSLRLDSDGTSRFLLGGLGNDVLRMRPNGKIAIGGTGANEINFYNHWQLGNGAGPAAFLAAGAVDTTATSSATYYLSQANVLNGVTLSNLAHFRASWGNVGSNVTIGSYIGLDIAGTSLSNVYAMQSNLQSGSNRWNLFLAGTAPNYLRGNLNIGAFNTVQNGDAVLGLATGTSEPTGAGISSVQLYSIEDSPGNTMLGLRTQGNQPATESLSADRSVKVRINGVTYKLLLKAI